MEEKERYSWYNHSTEEIYDNKDDVVFVGAITVLNQQNRRIWELIEENQQLKQSQKQLAIEKLEEVKKILSFDAYNITDNRFDCTRTIILWDDLNSLIDNQVKKLKGRENE